MIEHPEQLATDLLHYFEQEEARLSRLRGMLTQLQACLVQGELAQLSTILERLLQQMRYAENLHTDRESLKRKLPLSSDGRVDWPTVERLLSEDTALALRRQRERLCQLASAVQRDLRRVAVLAWFGQELYGRMLAAILNHRQDTSGNYDRLGTTSNPSCGQLIQLLS